MLHDQSLRPAIYVFQFWDNDAISIVSLPTLMLLVFVPAKGVEPPSEMNILLPFISLHYYNVLLPECQLSKSRPATVAVSHQHDVLTLQLTDDVYLFHPTFQGVGKVVLLTAVKHQFA